MIPAIVYVLGALLAASVWLLLSEIRHSERIGEALCDATRELDADGELAPKTVERIRRLAKEVGL